jgi:hypothetical protein
MITKEELDKIKGVHINSPDCSCSDCLYEMGRLLDHYIDRNAPRDYTWFDAEGNLHSVDGDLLQKRGYY